MEKYEYSKDEIVNAIKGDPPSPIGVLGIIAIILTGIIGGIIGYWTWRSGEAIYKGIEQAKGVLGTAAALIGLAFMILPLFFMAMMFISMFRMITEIV